MLYAPAMPRSLAGPGRRVLEQLADRGKETLRAYLLNWSAEQGAGVEEVRRTSGRPTIKIAIKWSNLAIKPLTVFIACRAWQDPAPAWSMRFRQPGTWSPSSPLRDTTYLPL